MTFYDISMKMLTVNFRRYKLYFLCNMFSIMLFYSFAAIFTNKSFMNRDIVDSMISSNIYAPSIFVAVFIVLFVPYSYNAFSKNRKHEYGILMTLGMSETEVLKNMILENCIIAGLSLIAGLIIGTAVSFVFYFIIRHVIGVSGLRWYFNPDSYKYTVILYGATILLALVTGILGFVKTQISDLIKEKFSAEKRVKSLPGIFMEGVAMIIISVLIMTIGYNGISNIWFISIVIMFAGLYIVITNVESAGQYLGKKILHYMNRHILEMSFIRRHNKSRGIIGMAAALLIGFCIFFAGFCIESYWSIVHNAITYSPYDMVYSQVFGMNQVEDSEIESLLNKNGVSVKAVNQVNYLRSRVYNLLPVSEVNENFNCHYKVPQGKFLAVFQYDLNDGYKHELTSPEIAYFNCGSEKIKLHPKGGDVRILFNWNPVFADRTLVLNDADYSKIASRGEENWAGVMNLYTFDGWKNSKKGIDAVQKYLQDKNNISQLEQSRYYRASSKIESYTTAKQSAEFLTFMMIFIEVLFCAASDIMIHFKIKSEEEEEQRMLSGLYRIGVTSGEMQRMIQNKNIHYYIPQVIIGLLTGVFYCFILNEFYEHTWKAAWYSLVFGMALVFLQLVFVRRYSEKELLSFGI